MEQQCAIPAPYSFDKVKLVTYLVTFFTLAPLTLITSFLALNSLNSHTITAPQAEIKKNLIELPRFGVQVYASLPSQQSLVTTTITSADARVEIVRQYLEKYKSPLLPHAELLVAVADQYNLDFRLLVAIAQQESNLCKKIPEGTYNCWGWGIHSRGTLGFPDYPVAIHTVAQGLKEDYFDKGYTTVTQIMSKYTPMSNGSWAAGVNQFLSEME